MNENKNTPRDGIDETLDALLKNPPVQPSADFTARTLERIRADRAAEPARRAFLPFPGWLAGLGAAAALVLTAFLWTNYEPPAGSATGEAAALATLAEDPELAQILLLADGLSAASYLTDEDGSLDWLERTPSS